MNDTVSLGTNEIADQITHERTSSVGWHIQRLAARLDDAMEKALEPHGLSVQSFAVVMTVLEHDGLTQTQIGARFRAPAYAISRSIDALEKDGFLERRTHATSKRAKTIHATAKAQRLAPDLLVIIRDVNSRLLFSLNDRETTDLRSGLQRVLGDNQL